MDSGGVRGASFGASGSADGFLFGLLRGGILFCARERAVSHRFLSRVPPGRVEVANLVPDERKETVIRPFNDGVKRLTTTDVGNRTGFPPTGNLPRHDAADAFQFAGGIAGYVVVPKPEKITRRCRH